MISAVVAVLAGLAFAGLASVARPAFADDDSDDHAPPCTSAARACVDLSTQRAWLMQNGTVTYGPVKISSGGPGEETPVGTFKVQWKDRNHVSTEVAGAPMPYSTFFAPGGVAFHGGSVTRASAGCVHLDTKDAIVFYDTLKIGDEVQVRTSSSSGPTESSKPTPEPSAEKRTESSTKPAAERHDKSSTPTSALAAPLL